MKYLVACRLIDAHYFCDVASSVLVKRVAEKRASKRWYCDSLYSPLLPFKGDWSKLKYKFWWDVINTECHEDILKAIHMLDEAVKNKEEQTIGDIEDILDTIAWLSHWASKGAYFMLT